MPDVYITRISNFLPNESVSNDEMEKYLGLINKQPSKSKKIILRNNGIKSRYYAINREGKATHTNSEMASLAIKKLFNDNPDEIKDIDLLSCGTSSPDQMMPSHGVMVQGWLPETDNIEVVSLAGVCCSGMHAFKYAFNGRKNNILNIQLSILENNQYQLIIKDNGIGLPPEFEKGEKESLGMDLVKILTEQIDGELIIKNDNGAFFSIIFNNP